jgi:hypothetical protein
MMYPRYTHPFVVPLTNETKRRLRLEAMKRNYVSAEMVKLLLEHIIDHNLIDAILDNKEPTT